MSHLHDAIAAELRAARDKKLAPRDRHRLEHHIADMQASMRKLYRPHADEDDERKEQ